ncbi:U7 snRNA-associated Sm-like protein LSm11 [Orussus abietinus]|uniref:U7 snRNA-associated Sm-like protein LSm11 n=1 Tax=Orussus abietinus TaxID=222816 RepID=UPI000626717B|nr:U7 snRNA-associated Sm-like protein LSm11 [Orussus abietinus]
MAAESGSSSDESLSSTSDKFDPLKALYSPKLRLPHPTAPIYDNVCKYESVMKGIAHISSKKDAAPGRASGAAGQSRRRFLPHQEPVQGKGRGRRNEDKNLFAKMEKSLGPLGMLYTYMENRTRVKVYTRSERGVRGHVEAYVVAFDKHWNLALEDCLEVWTRKIKRKAPALGLAADSSARPQMPKVIVRRTDAKGETLERHVPQLLIRGEQVAVVVKIG